MSEPKTECIDCGCSILQSTADDRNGRCAPCQKQRIPSLNPRKTAFVIVATCVIPLAVSVWLAPHGAVVNAICPYCTASLHSRYWWRFHIVERVTENDISHWVSSEIPGHTHRWEPLNSRIEGGWLQTLLDGGEVRGTLPLGLLYNITDGHTPDRALQSLYSSKHLGEDGVTAALQDYHRLLDKYFSSYDFGIAQDVSQFCLELEGLPGVHEEP
ncbi:MAG: hypothetical protein KDB27_28850 [Planctomycetales bacterium]|nr:hypothetical protein [Planctomycetales bacterium]